MLRISFDFDPETQKVSNVSVKGDDPSNNTTAPDLTVEDSKLNLSFTAIGKLNAVAGDRIAINYWTVDNTTTFPVISKADAFNEGSEGNKLTKKGTVSFKGQQRTTLLKFGNTFGFEEFVDKAGEVREGIYKLVPVVAEPSKEESLEDEEQLLTSANKVSGIEDEIAAMLEDDQFDVLPF